MEIEEFENLVVEILMSSGKAPEQIARVMAAVMLNSYRMGYQDALDNKPPGY